MLGRTPSHDVRRLHPHLPLKIANRPMGVQVDGFGPGKPCTLKRNHT